MTQKLWTQSHVYALCKILGCSLQVALGWVLVFVCCALCNLEVILFGRNTCKNEDTIDHQSSIFWLIFLMFVSYNLLHALYHAQHVDWSTSFHILVNCAKWDHILY